MLPPAPDVPAPEAVPPAPAGSVIVEPAPQARLRVGETQEIWGWGWADEGIAGIEVALGENGPWIDEALEQLHARCWQRFLLPISARTMVS